jgi:hypothetical protein
MEIGGRCVGNNVVSRATVVSASRSARDGRADPRPGARAQGLQRLQPAFGCAGTRHVGTPHRRAHLLASPRRAATSAEGER